MTFSKTCTKCCTTKDVALFSRKGSPKARGAKCADGVRRRASCRDCDAIAARAWNIAHPDRVRERSKSRNGTLRQKAASLRERLKRYGLTVVQYEDLSASQDAVCILCCGASRTGKRLAVDHDHTTGDIRGLLCAACNTSLGLLKESPATYAASLVYLAAHGKPLSPEDLADLLRAYPVKRAKRYTLHRKSEVANQ